MKNRTYNIALVFLLLISFSCSRKSEKDSIKYFEFSFNDTFHSSYTLIYKPKDSLYVRQHWSANDIYDSVKIPRGKTNYTVKLNVADEERLVKLISSIKLGKIEDEYFENYSDGTTYAVFIEKDSVNKMIAVHSHKAPKELDSLARWIYRLKEKLKLIPTRKRFETKSSKYVVPPPPPPLVPTM